MRNVPLINRFKYRLFLAGLSCFEGAGGVSIDQVPVLSGQLTHYSPLLLCLPQPVTQQEVEP